MERSIVLERYQAPAGAYPDVMGRALLAQEVIAPPLTQGAEARRDYLASLPDAGFESRREYDELVNDIVSIGLPVDNFTSLTKRPNTEGMEGAIGSWGTGRYNDGDFSVYDLLDYLPREKRLSTLVHEGLHANSPLDPRNTERFGGPRARAEAVAYAQDIAEQSLLTGRFIDGYQHWLAKQYAAEKIEWPTFVEETLAIAGEQAVTNRKHLQQVQAAQQAVFQRGRARGVIDPSVSFTPLVSDPSKWGTRTMGVDKFLTRLFDGVHSQQDLLAHADRLKVQFRSPERPATERQPFPRSRHVIIIINPVWIEDIIPELFGRSRRR